MKNIWIFNHYAIPPELGPLTRHYKLGEQLVKRGYKVQIFASSALHYMERNMIDDKSSFLMKKFNNVPFVFLKTMNYSGNGKKRILNMFQYAYRIAFTVPKMNIDKPDAIYASSAHPLTWVSAYYLSKRYRCKFIAETRDLWPESLIMLGETSRNSITAKLLFLLERFIYKNANQLVFTFPGGIEYIKKLGIDTDKVHYINNGVDLDEFNQLLKLSTGISEKMLPYSDFFKVVYAGSIGKPNGVDNLIRAAEILRDKGHNKIKILIFGDGKERKTLEEYTKKKNLNNVEFYGRVEKNEIPSVITRADLNIITGVQTELYKYGLSLNKMFEYFAAGKPILSNVECGYDLILKHKCGVTIRGNDPELIVEKIIYFSELSKAEYNKYCENARAASTEYDFAKLADKLEMVFR